MTTLRLRKYVKRYTTLSSALETLMKLKLVLLSPSKWDDSNDAFFMDLYRNHVEAQSVVALCCTMATETYHHWKIFTQGIEGVCIEFERQPLARALNALPNVTARPVEYLKIDDLKRMTADDVERIPFVKRLGYRDEREWRVVAQCPDTTAEYRDVPIDLAHINRITLNPWMPPSLADNLRAIIKGIDGCARISVVASKLTNSREWKDAGRGVFEPGED